MIVLRSDPVRVTRRRHGGILFELMLSLALFVGAATFALTATRSVFTRLDRSKREAAAVDLARSKLAELDAGLISIADLRGEGAIGLGSFETIEDDTAGPRWALDATVERTEFPQLSLVALTVSDASADELFGAGTAAVSVTLRQLVRLRGEDAAEYEADELLEGVDLTPEEGSP